MLIFLIFKANLCKKENCSGNGVCYENNANDTIYCKCNGGDLYFEGKRCEIVKQTKISLDRNIKITVAVAIISIVLFYSMFIFLDWHRWFLNRHLRGLTFWQKLTRKNYVVKTTGEVLKKPNMVATWDMLFESKKKKTKKSKIQ